MVIFYMHGDKVSVLELGLSSLDALVMFVVAKRV